MYSCRENAKTGLSIREYLPRGIESEGDRNGLGCCFYATIAASIGLLRGWMAGRGSKERMYREACDSYIHINVCGRQQNPSAESRRIRENGRLYWRFR
jgi:hypothetical protein